MPVTPSSPAPWSSETIAARARPAAEITLGLLEEHRSTAQRDNNEGRHGQARQEFARLLRRIASLPPEAGARLGVEALRELTVRTALGLSFACVATARWDEAMRALDEAAYTCGPDRPDLRSLVERQRGVAYANVGRTRDALAHFQSALAQRERLAVGDILICLLNVALLHAHLGDFAAAHRETAELLELADPARHPTERFMATYNAGMIAYLEGDLPRALAMMAAADTMPVAITRAPGLTDQGRVLLDAGLVEDAIDVLTIATAEAAEGGRSLFLAQVQATLADAYLVAGRHTEAYAAARAAVTHLGRRASATMRDEARLAVLAIRLARGDSPRAIVQATAPILERALQDRSLLAVRARLLTAEALLPSDPRAAGATLPHVIPNRLSLSDRLRWRRVRAESAATLGHRGRARAELRAAATELQEAQARIASLDLGAARARHTEPLARLDLRLAMTSGPAAVYEATERWRAAMGRLAAVRPPEDPVAAELIAQLRATHARLEGADERERSGIRAQIHALEREIRRRDWGDSSDGPQGQVRPLAAASAIAELAEAGVDACSFFEAEGEIHVVVCRRGRISVERCLPLDQAVDLTHRVCADLRMRTAYGPMPMTGAIDASLTRNLAALDGALLGPVRSRQRAVVVVPCRAISGLPWGVLPSLAQRPLTIARSISGFLGRLPQPVSGIAPKVAVLTGPGLGPVAEAERQAIASAWSLRAEPVVDGASSRAGAQVAFRESDVVHIAAHGRHEGRSPLFSWLELGDGRLFAHELRAGGVGAAHVVLAACEVGRTTVRPGENSLGFAATLLALGAQTVVAAQLPVPDDVAATVMTGYHAGLVQGRPSDEALALAVAAAGPFAGVFAAFGSRWVV